MRERLRPDLSHLESKPMKGFGEAAPFHQFLNPERNKSFFRS